MGTLVVLPLLTVTLCGLAGLHPCSATPSVDRVQCAFQLCSTAEGPLIYQRHSQPPPTARLRMIAEVPQQADSLDRHHCDYS